MKIGLVGFAGSGKSTIFQWLTGDTPDHARVQQGQVATADLPDPRVDRMVAIFKPDEEKAVRSFQLLTLKPEIVFVNLGEGGRTLPADLLALAPDALAAPAKLELELEDLSPEDRAAFAADLGVTGSQRDDILR